MKRTIAILFTMILLLSLTAGCVMKDSGTTEETTEMTEETVETTENETPVAEATPAEKAPPVAPRKSYGEVVFDEQTTLTEFPTTLTTVMEEGMKYNIQFQTDQPIQFVVYSEQRYNEWQNSGAHTISKATTKSGDECCANEGSFTIDINEGEAGKYYIVFDDGKLNDLVERPTTGSVTVTKVSNI